MAGLSIIIPTLNEANCLPYILRCLSALEPPAVEIIIVDGGSQDQTRLIADNYGITTISSPIARRSFQMNLGAKAATTELLCFLHADTLVPNDLVTLIEMTLAEPQIAGGGFICLMSGQKTTRWDISLHNYLKTYYAPLIFRPHLFFFKGLRLLFGDQVMFCRQTDFWDCGGFDSDLPIMEDADLCLKLVNKGRICLINRVVQSSDRRVAALGTLKAHGLYLWLGFLWGLGVSATYLKGFYPDIRT
ncbi:MAG TPA: glycosyltransferase [Cyanothece sp. UBA12306]|nr:glycosyltransferase [Cyanothece sp. UBA12306]